MQMVDIGRSGLMGSRIVQGCMRFAEEGDAKKAAQVVENAYSLGINMFDNANIYGGGECERMFGQALRDVGLDREKVIVQTKVGIENWAYDFSKQHILEKVDASLKRLNMDYIDILLLHRPDILAEPEEVAEAFNELQNSGKVGRFGVSNQHPMQIELLEKHLSQKLVANQLQFSPVHTGMVDIGIHVNTEHPMSIHRDGMILDYCRLKDIQIQAWSPFQKGHIEGPFLLDDKYKTLNDKIHELAAAHGVSDSAIVVAWILRHPAKMQVLTGSTNPERVQHCVDALDVTLSREEWYDMYKAAGNEVP